MRRPRHHEKHAVERTGWLRAAVLGANDGVVSTASLIVGVAAAGSSREAVVVAGTAALVAGAMSMAAGEYVSVSSQSDSEAADLARERRELAANVEAEEEELAQIYVKRGLEPGLAHQVALQLMAHDALGAHARDELGMSEATRPRPVQAAFASALSFAVGAALPLLTAWLARPALTVPLTAGLGLVYLVALGLVGARAGGADPWRGAARVAFWGAAAFAVTFAAGRLFGAGG